MAPLSKATSSGQRARVKRKCCEVRCGQRDGAPRERWWWRRACGSPGLPCISSAWASGRSLVLPANFPAWLSIPCRPPGFQVSNQPADPALENWAVCLAPLEGRRRQWNRRQFRSRHNSWLKPNMTDLPSGRLFHLLFNARNKYLHDPALEGMLCDNSPSFPAKHHCSGAPERQREHSLLR